MPSFQHPPSYTFDIASNVIQDKIGKINLESPALSVPDKPSVLPGRENCLYTNGLVGLDRRIKPAFDTLDRLEVRSIDVDALSLLDP